MSSQKLMLICVSMFFGRLQAILGTLVDARCIAKELRKNLNEGLPTSGRTPRLKGTQKQNLEARKPLRIVTPWTP